MRVRVKLNATLRRYLPSDADGSTASVELRDGATVSDLLAVLGIPPGYTKMIVCGDEHLALEAVLNDGQSLQLFPPLAG